VGHGEQVSAFPLGMGHGEGLKMRIFVRSPAHLECLFLQRNTYESRPALRLPTLTYHYDTRLTVARSAEEGTGHYLPW